MKVEVGERNIHTPLVVRNTKIGSEIGRYDEQNVGSLEIKGPEEQNVGKSEECGVRKAKIDVHEDRDSRKSDKCDGEAKIDIREECVVATKEHGVQVIGDHITAKSTQGDAAKQVR
eukprot:TRINITY_DN23175_c0_g1_i1.p2 TRINITY_DN23175_c0_g1~~TRINITY_DN23175_c0_g1_i1.p2  ORF type:complete len:116 (+),score=11.05 TRINITY_DN23175_c0_g1_i1:289-636(+)